MTLLIIDKDVFDFLLNNVQSIFVCCIFEELDFLSPFPFRTKYLNLLLNTQVFV